MRVLIKLQLITMVFANVIAINAFSNSNAANNKATSNVQAALDKAKKSGNAVFVVVTGTGTTDTDKATAMAKKANASYKKAIIVQMDRDNAANADLVDQWRLAGAPLPLILVISPKGYPTGGFILAEATAEKLVELIPSPKLDDVYVAINNSKPVFLVLSKKSHTDRANILENCNLAASQLRTKAAVIEVDLSDKKEAGFVKNLNLKNVPNSSSVMVLNASGQVTGTFEGPVATIQLVLAANKVVRSGGCGTSCSPGACPPQK